MGIGIGGGGALCIPPAPCIMAAPAVISAALVAGSMPPYPPAALTWGGVAPARPQPQKPPLAQ